MKIWERAIKDSKINYYDCVSTPFAGTPLGQLSPSQQASVRKARCSYYLERKSELEKELKEKREKLEDTIQFTKESGQQQYSKIYSECLNK